MLESRAHHAPPPIAVFSLPYSGLWSQFIELEADIEEFESIPDPRPRGFIDCIAMKKNKYFGTIMVIFSVLFTNFTKN